MLNFNEYTLGCSSTRQNSVF